MRGEDGSVTVVLAAVVGLVAVLAVAVGGLSQVVAALDRAQTAADAAALAAAPVTFRPFGSSGDAVGEARRFARANGAELSRCTGCGVDRSWRVRTVEVEVAVVVDLLVLGRSTVTGVAAAEFSPIQLLGAP